jgi:transposase
VVMKELLLPIRLWQYSNYELVHERDRNAVQNIARVGRMQIVKVGRGLLEPKR